MTRRRLVWTGPSMRWWDKLGHREGCPCGDVRGAMGVNGGQRTVDDDTFRSVMSCWRYATGQIRRQLNQREGVWATRAMWAFRDRATGRCG